MSKTKSDIVEDIALGTNLSKKLSQDLLEYFIFFLKNNLKKNNLIKISNFGTFEVRTTPSRIGRNPKTKEEFKISERNRVTLNTSKKIKDILN